MSNSIRLGDLGTGHVWFTSLGHPTGCDLIAEEGEPLSLPGDVLGGDQSDWWDLSGTVEAGRWVWDGTGAPCDWRQNSVRRIVAFV